MTASTATRRGPATDTDLRTRLAELRQRHPDWSEGQLRHQLQHDGYPLSAVMAAIRGDDDKARPAPKAPEQKPPASTPPSAPSRGGGSQAGGLWQAPGTASGVLLALVAYPAFLAYLRGGNAGLTGWFRAKFLNQTDTDPGIASEAWLVPGSGTGTGTTGGTIATSLTGRRKRAASPAASGSAGAVLAFARAQIGKPYRWGGSGPNSWDCSGLTQAAWRAAGVSIPRTTTMQLATLASVKRADMQPGDLVFPEPTHVQLYAGGGQIIEAPHTGLDVRQTKLGPVFAVRRPRMRGVAA